MPPGVLIVEAIAQAGGTLLLPEVPDRDELLIMFTSIERAKFRRPVVPGDQLRIEIDVRNWKPRRARMEGRALVDGKLACEATVMCQLIPKAAQEKAAEKEAAATTEPTAATGAVSGE